MINYITKNECIATLIISDKGSAFASHLLTELADVPGITLDFATIQHAQTNRMLARTQVSMNKALKIKTGERRSIWLKYVDIAVLNYKTVIHTSIGCQHSRVLHGLFPYNILDLKTVIVNRNHLHSIANLPKVSLSKPK